MKKADPSVKLLESPPWNDYELLDSGDGLKLERFGPYRLVRPEAQAMWTPTLSQDGWRGADAVFQPTSEESGGHWKIEKKIAERWEMQAPPATLRPSSAGKGSASEGGVKFWAMTTPGRHLGVFPEGAAHWQWLADLIDQSKRPIRVLNLFGYTGLASLAAAASGAAVTHVDASKKAVRWAKDNQSLSGLEAHPIRWIVDDALKFVRREARREARYDGILLDPPKFGRGPKGEVWEVYKSLPELLETCRAVLSPNPLFVVLTMYAVRASAVHLYYALQDLLEGFSGRFECGELVTREQSAGRLISNAVYARWEAER
jgi:23S rRNA (cytosine1962-C5)-methyltransferase